MSQRTGALLHLEGKGKQDTIITRLRRPRHLLFEWKIIQATTTVINVRPWVLFKSIARSDPPPIDEITQHVHGTTNFIGSVVGATLGTNSGEPEE